MEVKENNYCNCCDKKNVCVNCLFKYKEDTI